MFENLSHLHGLRNFAGSKQNKFRKTADKNKSPLVFSPSTLLGKLWHLKNKFLAFVVSTE
jgi:hypothetical protein